MKNELVLRTLSADETVACSGQLAQVLLDCVEGGASVSFMLPLAEEKALQFWRGVADGVGRGQRTLLVAEDSEGIVGTVQLITDMPDNQPHRADVAKLLVKRRARSGGIGRLLMEAVEQSALAQGRTLLVLDTANATAERLYERLGWQRVGVVPDYALLPEGGLCATTFYYKRLDASRKRPRGGSGNSASSAVQASASGAYSHSTLTTGPTRAHRATPIMDFGTPRASHSYSPILHKAIFKL